MTHIWPDHCRHLLGSRCVWYSKTNISRMLVRQTDTQHVDISSANPGSSAGSERPPQSRHYQPTQTRELEGGTTDAAGCVGSKHPNVESTAAIVRRDLGRPPCPLQTVNSHDTCLLPEVTAC